MRIPFTFGAAAILTALFAQPGPGYGQSQGEPQVAQGQPGQSNRAEAGEANNSPNQPMPQQPGQPNRNRFSNQQPQPSQNAQPQRQPRLFFSQHQPLIQGNRRWFYPNPSQINPKSPRMAWQLLSDLDRETSASYSPADEAIRAQLNLPKDQGLIVINLDPSSPEAAAGIESNDVLLQLENDRGQSVSLGKPEDLNWLKAAGDRPMTLVLLRRGQRLKLKVQPRVTVSLGPVRPQPPSYWIGVSVGTVEPALRAQLQIPQDEGLIVINVVKDSPAAAAGIQPNDILLKLDGNSLEDQAKLIQLVQAKERKTVALEILRAGKRQTIQITPQPRTMGWDEPKSAVFGFAHPGAISVQWDQGSQDGTWIYDVTNNALTLNHANTSPPKEARESDPTTTKRLDDLSAQVKELRQAIDALIKATQEKK
jgi:hypothetical protein